MFVRAVLAASIFAATSFACGPALSQETDWALITSTKNGSTWEAKKGSGEIKKTRGGDAVYSAFFRVFNGDDKTWSYHQIFTRLSDCANGYGKVVTTDTSGNFMFDFDFVLSSNKTAADGLAIAICGAAQKAMKHANDNSI